MATDGLARWRVPSGRPFPLAHHPADDAAGAPGPKDVTARAAADLNDELTDLQARLWAENRRSLLVVLQAMDAGGKDGTIKKVFSGVNPQGTEVTSFKAPDDEERAHDFLWRVHRAVPARGRIGIFNRSHYEDVLVVRVHGHVTAQECEARYRAINEFERLLVSEGGTTIVKLMLHVSKAEQAARLQSRLDDPAKRWKFRRADLDERERWDDYMAAYGDALGATSTPHAPWYVVPADRKWYRDWVALTIITETLRRMAPRYPEPEEDLEGVVVA